MIESAGTLSLGGNYVFNIFRLFYGLVAVIYLSLQVVFFSTCYVYLVPSVAENSIYGVLLYWNTFKIIVVGLIIFCCIQSRLPLPAGFVFGSVIGCVVIGTFALFLLLLTDAIFKANTVSAGANHPGNDPLYCCVFYEQIAGCLTKGPCLNINTTTTPLQHFSQGENIDIVEVHHLFLNPNFKLALILTPIILAVELFILAAFIAILHSITEGRGLFLDTTVTIYDTEMFDTQRSANPALIQSRNKNHAEYQPSSLNPSGNNGTKWYTRFDWMRNKLATIGCKLKNTATSVWNTIKEPPTAFGQHDILNSGYSTRQAHTGSASNGTMQQQRERERERELEREVRRQPPKEAQMTTVAPSVAPLEISSQVHFRGSHTIQEYNSKLNSTNNHIF